MNDFVKQTPKIGLRNFIHKNAVVSGDVTLGNDVSVWPHTVIRGDVNFITIGDRTNIQDNSVLHVTHIGETIKGCPLIVGNNVTVGHRVILHGCTVGDHCLVGMGAIVMDDVIVEPNSIIGAGSVVTMGKTIESGTLWLGNPAKLVRKLTQEEIDYLQYSANHYVRLKNTYLKQKL